MVKRQKKSRVIGDQFHKFTTLRFWRRSRCKNKIWAIYHRSQEIKSTKLPLEKSDLKLKGDPELWNMCDPVFRTIIKLGRYAGVRVSAKKTSGDTFTCWFGRNGVFRKLQQNNIRTWVHLAGDLFSFDDWINLKNIVSDIFHKPVFLLEKSNKFTWFSRLLELKTIRSFATATWVHDLEIYSENFPIVEPSLDLAWTLISLLGS